jgi:hypothetical protein
VIVFSPQPAKKMKKELSKEILDDTMVFTIMAKHRILVCPICGDTQPETNVCRVCETFLEPEGLALAEGAIGPWWIRNEELPFRPGKTYEHMAELAKNAKIDLDTIMRGPTTRQLWKPARRVKGIAHLLGRCHKCGEHVEPDSISCTNCHEPFLKYTKRNEMGLEAGEPIRGEPVGMSSFTSDANIFDTCSEPLTLPKQTDHQPETQRGDTDSIASPQFRAVQRQLEQSSRRNIVLLVSLVVSLIALGAVIYFK